MTTKIINRYIAAEFLFSFFVVFLFFFFIFFINQILLMAEQILSKHVAAVDVIRLILFAIPNIISYSFPFAALVGGLMAVGRLGGDNELMAMQAVGIPLRRIALPFLFMGVIVGALAFFSNDVLLPLGTMKFNTLYREILYSNPALELESNSIKRYQDRIIATGDVRGGRIDNIVIIDRDDKKNIRTITAAEAVLSKDTSGAGVISLELEDVVSLVADKKRSGDYEYSTAERMKYNILLKDITMAVHSLTPREKSVRDILREIEAKQKQLDTRISDHRQLLESDIINMSAVYDDVFLNPRGFEKARLKTLFESVENLGKQEIRDRSLQMHLLEFHKKIALPAACVIFLIFAFPAGVLSRRSGRSIGFGIGLFVCVIYWGMLFAGQTLGIRSNFSPMLSIWSANIIILLAGIILLFLRTNR